MTIDTDGNLWVAVFDGGRVLHVDPRTSKLLATIEIPAKQVLINDNFLNENVIMNIVILILYIGII